MLGALGLCYPMTEILLVYSTFPDQAKAESVAKDLIESGHAACVTLSQPVTSVYRWEGKLCRETEVHATIKTSAPSFDALCARLVQLHPYDCPELVAVPVLRGHPEYLEWVHEQSSPTA